MDETTSNKDFLLSLKEATADKHRDIEKCTVLTKVFSETVNIDDYIEAIKRFYSFYTLLEPIVYSHKEIAKWLPDLETRKKLYLLQKDLEILNQENLEASTQFQIPALNSTSETWGCLYVLEGSTLGGQIISRHLHNKLGIKSHFYTAYADKTSEMWKEFCKAICLYEQAEGNKEIIIESAIATFASLERGFQ